jgi:MFS family permease
MAISDSEFVREFRRNWRILLVAFSCFVFAFSAPAFLLPFLYPEVIREFGWSREQAVFLASYKYLTGSIVAIVVGCFVDIIGVRRVLIFVSVLGGLALVSFLWTPGLVAYYAAGVMLGFAGAGTMVTIKVLISRAHHVSQATAMAVAMLGTSVGQTIVPFVATFLIADYGWRAGSALLSSGIWLVALPLMIVFLKGGTIDDDRPPSPVFAGTVVKGLAGERRFWLILIAVFAAGFVDQALTQHLVLYLRLDLGLSTTIVATVLSAIGLFGFVTRPFVGGLFDGLSTRGVALAYLVLATACVLALGALSPVLLSVFVVLRAVGHSAVLLDTLVLTKHVFGLKHIGILLGIYTAAVNFGFAIGPAVVSRLHAQSGSYTLAFIVCAVVAVVAALAVLPARPDHWLQSKQQGQAGAGPLVSG